MTPAETVAVELIAKTQGFDARIRQSADAFDRSMGRIERDAGDTERKVTRSFDRMGKTGLNFGSLIGRATAGLGALAATTAIAGLIDASKQIDAQLRLATRATGDFGKATSDVRRIAAETRSELGATAQLYATFQRNALQLGITQNESARATETVTKAFRISGATAAEAAGGLRQFVQGIQSGTLRGEELNSVLENAPRLAALLASSIKGANGEVGITIGELRKLGEEGELTAERLITALTDRKFTAAIDEEFRELPVTFGEAIQGITNAATIAFGAFDEGGEFSKAILSFVTTSGDGLDDLADSARAFGNDTRAEIDGIIAAIGPLIDAYQDLKAVIDTIGGPPSGKIFNFEQDFRNFDKLFGTTTADRFTQARDASAASRAPDNLQRDFARLAADAGITGVGLDGPRSRPARTSGGSGSRRGGSGASAQRRAEQEAARAERERLDAIRDAASFERDVARASQAIADVKAQLLIAAEDLAQAEVDRIEFERQRANRDLEVDVQLGQLTAEQAKQLQGLNDERARLLTEIAKRTANERKFRADEESRQRALDVAAGGSAVQGEILQGQLDLAETQRERLDLERRLIDLQFAEERARNDYLIGYAERLRLQEGITESEQAEADAQAELARLRNASLEQRQASAEASADRANASPLQALLQSIPDTATEINEQLEAIAAGGLTTLVDGLTDAIVNFRSFGDVGRAVLQSLTAGLVKLALQQLLLKAIGGTAGNAAVGQTTAQAGAAATAWAPAAALASLATLGSNAGPAALALAGTTALAQALAATGGLKDGGPVSGPGGSRGDKILTRLSDGEFVINAASSRALGRQALEYMNATGQLPGMRAAGGAVVPGISIPNAPASPSGGGFGSSSIDERSIARLSQVVGEAARAMPAVQLFPTLDPGRALAAGLNSPGGQQVFFDFVGQNAGRFNAAINR